MRSQCHHHVHGAAPSSNPTATEEEEKEEEVRRICNRRLGLKLGSSDKGAGAVISGNAIEALYADSHALPYRLSQWTIRCWPLMHCRLNSICQAPGAYCIQAVHPRICCQPPPSRSCPRPPDRHLREFVTICLSSPAWKLSSPGAGHLKTRRYLKPRGPL